ncbi:YitT family protein [Vagococcus coleopterorum]|uniref:YitT family protein n=1 Tax=Vagococcus coleopterorum TaxID=2714946 RepID=A0A6G8ALK7_9ENTE|nr:YitT family protein [Vagococcus coleopterorum]QIL45860.1 YitT family protein [Vagococcus coleopterorum]
MQKTQAVPGIQNQNFPLQLFLAALNGLFVAVGINFFLLPHSIYSNGITAVGQVINAYTDHFLNFEIMSIGTWVFVLSVPLILLSWFKLGKNFTVLSLVSVFSTMVVMNWVPVIKVSGNPLLSAAVGGAVMGYGAALCYKYGFSPGGLDILIAWIKKATGKNVGAISLVINAIVYTLAAVLDGFDILLYSLVTLYVMTMVMDKFYTQQQLAETTIFTKHPENVETILTEKFPRGATVMDKAYGMYTKENVVVYTVVSTQYELSELYKLIDECDKAAFVRTNLIYKVKGNFQKDHLS